MFLTSWIKEIGVSGILDLASFWLCLYLLLVWFKKTRTAFVLTGILIVSAFYLFTRLFNMSLTASLLENFFAILLIALVVIFQEELRHFFERVAVWSLNREFIRQKVLYLSREEVQVVVRTLVDLAKERIGALVVIRGKDLIVRHLRGGTDLNGELSEALLKSLFDPHSMGHDGAVIIEGNRITQFSSYLPLTKNLKKLGSHGTRHAAALGLSELTDALAVVASEERGTITVIKGGELQTISDPDQLTVLIEKHYQETYPQKETTLWNLIKKNGKEKLIAAVLALAIWFVFSYGSRFVYRTYRVPVQVPDLPPPWVLAGVNPQEVDITLNGPRKSFYFLDRDRLRPSISFKLAPGSQLIRLTSKNFPVPKEFTLDAIDPRDIKIQIDEIPKPVKK